MNARIESRGITTELLLEVFDIPVSFHRCLVPVAGGVAIQGDDVFAVAGLREPGQDTRAGKLLLGRHDHYECWRKKTLPARWRYGTHPLIPAIVCQMDPGWDALWPKKYEYRLQQQAGHTRGSHGYDPDLPEMRATFIASGPSFRPGTRLPVFDNVDVYPLLMRLLGLPPQPNDGDARTFDPVLSRR